MQRPNATTTISHRWIQGAIPKVVGNQMENLIKQIQRMKKNYPSDIIKRLALRAVAYCYVLKSASLDKILITFFHYLDYFHTGSITSDGLQALVPNYLIEEIEGRCYVN